VKVVPSDLFLAKNIYDGSINKPPFFGLYLMYV
jgi:hypothetical protein